MLLLRRGQEADADLLGQMNQGLIAAEGSENTMSEWQLANRMKAMLAGGWQAVLAEDESGPIGYCLFSYQKIGLGGRKEIYIRHFFLKQECRGCGIGKQFFDRLQQEFFPPDANIAVDALAQNSAACGFWQSVGLKAFSIQYRK
ncbi:GNAT family N-acetyltransferase [Azotosporobacter soli]|uniref:GNAT family N-acetyltransferase n=1 Tax=Azotosporobacter soli TaxID=3055040 RepID=UPI0031FF25B6